MLLRLLAFSALLCCAAPALALFKCESAGNVTYSDSPCTSGKTVELDDRTAKPAAADTSRARQQSAQEKKEATRLEADRHRREAKDGREQTQIARAAIAKRKKCTALAQRRKWSEEDAASASAKSIAKTQKKARRMAEKYEAECGK